MRRIAGRMSAEEMATHLRILCGATRHEFPSACKQQHAVDAAMHEMRFGPDRQAGQALISVLDLAAER